ncbi:MAG: hypothetical protein COA78_27615 [Blastopirellula sp.]|nr:MAG: hypothetical protein COA78_27615 [Blastopirellula sp.]
MVLRPVVLLLLLFSLGCGSSENSSTIAHDLTTPEGAVLTLEDAYRAKDVEAAIRCKDFQVEARLMLEKINPELAEDDLIAQTAEVLELGFRAEMRDSPPNFDGVSSTFSAPQPYNGRDDIVQLTETCSSSGGKTVNTLHAAKTADGWKVVSIPGD